MNTNQGLKGNEPQWLSLPMACARASLSEDFLRRLIAKKELKQFRAGRKILVDREELDHWIRGHAQTP